MIGVILVVEIVDGINVGCNPFLYIHPFVGFILPNAGFSHRFLHLGFLRGFRYISHHNKSVDNLVGHRHQPLVSKGKGTGYARYGSLDAIIIGLVYCTCNIYPPEIIAIYHIDFGINRCRISAVRQFYIEIVRPIYMNVIGCRMILLNPDVPHHNSSELGCNWCDGRHIPIHYGIYLYLGSLPYARSRFYCRGRASLCLALLYHFSHLPSFLTVLRFPVLA